MIAEKTYHQPKSVREAIRLSLEAQEGFRFLAGGTDVLVNKFQGNDGSACLIDITGIEALRSITVEGNLLQIGPLVTLEGIAANEIIRASFSALAEAAKSAATPVLRKTATIGGNLLCENRCSFYNQSKWWREAVGYCLKCDGDICIATGGAKKCFSRFVSDTAPVLIAFDARLLMEDEHGEYEVALEEIYTGDGLKPRNLSATSIVKKILLPLRDKQACVFMKLRPRESMDFTSLTTAVSVSASGDIKIVIGGVDPKPVVISGRREEQEELIRKAIKKPRIVDNDIYPRLYRKEMIGVFLKRSFDQIANPG